MDKELRIMWTDYYQASVKHEFEDIPRAIHRLKVLRACRYADVLIENERDGLVEEQRSYTNVVSLLMELGQLVEAVEGAMMDEIRKTPL